LTFPDTLVQKALSSILIVDDEVELASLYKQFFLTLGFDAISFTQPLLALEHYKQSPNKFSIVITDLRMPGMCGLELANKIREIDSTIKILLITAFDITDLKGEQSYQSAKISEIIQKPVKLFF
jgi:DNA-binding NtrC family response regulator